jgi:hypothetical protein
MFDDIDNLSMLEICIDLWSQIWSSSHHCHYENFVNETMFKVIIDVLCHEYSSSLIVLIEVCKAM